MVERYDIDGLEDFDFGKIPGRIFDVEKEVLKYNVRSIVLGAVLSAPFASGFYSGGEGRLELQDKMTDYIVGGNLNSGKDPVLEAEILKLSEYDWKIKYLLNNSNIPLKENLVSIMNEERNKNKKVAQPKGENSQSLLERGLEKGWDWLKSKIKGIGSHLVNLVGVPDNLGTVFGDMLTKAEGYIGRPYRRGSSDCSWFLSEIFRVGQGKQKMDRWVAKDFAERYKNINRNEIRCGDIIYQAKPAHVELIVSKPYVENGITYVNTIGLSTDKYEQAPMFDPNGNPIIGKAGVGYRKRKIAPNPRHPYTYHRPPYEQWAKKRA